MHFVAKQCTSEQSIISLQNYMKIIQCLGKFLNGFYFRIIWTTNNRTKIKPIQKFPTLITNFDIQSFCRLTVMALYRFFKPAGVNCQFIRAPARDADEAVELRLNTKPSSKCTGEYAKFTPEQQANIALYACMHGNWHQYKVTSLSLTC